MAEPLSQIQVEAVMVEGGREEKPNVKRNIRSESLAFKIPRTTVHCVLTIILPRGVRRKYISF